MTNECSSLLSSNPGYEDIPSQGGAADADPESRGFVPYHYSWKKLLAVTTSAVAIVAFVRFWGTETDYQQGTSFSFRSSAADLTPLLGDAKAPTSGSCLDFAKNKVYREHVLLDAGLLDAIVADT